jgi:tetratricopeptide (TPR) repeat protein
MRYFLAFVSVISALITSSALAADKRHWDACTGKDIEKAIAGCTAIIEARDENRKNEAIAYANRCRGFVVKQDYPRVIQDCSEAIRLNPNQVSSYQNRAVGHVFTKAYDLALADLTMAVKLDPKANEPWLYRMRGLSYHGKAEYDSAIAEYSMAIAADPNDATAYSRRGTSHSAKKIPEAYDRALADFQRALALYSDRPDNALGTHMNIGGVHSAKGDLQAAEAAFTDALKLKPAHADALTERAHVYMKLAAQGIYRQRNNDLAVADFSAVLQLTPSSIFARYNRGVAHERNGRRVEAFADYTAVLDANPADDETRRIVELAKSNVAALTGRASPQVSSAPPPPATITQPRVALVIGNSRYGAVGPVPNAQRDAEAVAASFRRLGFRTVRLETNLSGDAMRRALREFGRDAAAAEWAVIYYAGHGIELGGRNYLIPVDAVLASDRDVGLEAIPLDEMVATIGGAGKLRVVILDACRDNPFIARMTRTVATRSIGRGLGRFEPDGATLVAYAAKSGQIALDGAGTNSPFVTTLLKYIEAPGLEVNHLFRLVRDEVMTTTGKRQEPFVYGSLPAEDFYFRPK